MVAQTNTKKQLKLSDILEFTWDKKDTSTELTNNELERLKEKAQLYESQFNNE